jgi:acyl dehydratase
VDDLAHAEDLVVGTLHRLGEHEVSTEEIVAFARQWDPQPFHVDAEAARSGAFGELIGSGLHSMGILQRLTVEGVLRHWAVVAGRRIGDIELTAPLTGGLVVTGTVEVLRVELQPERGRGLVVTRGRLVGGGRTLLEARFETYVRMR